MENINQIITDVETIVGAISIVVGIISGYFAKHKKEKRKKAQLNYTEKEKQEIQEIAEKLANQNTNNSVYQPKPKTLDHGK